MPYEPRWLRSLRSLAELTPAARASSSLATVETPRSASMYSARRYTGSLATVASGMPPGYGRSAVDPGSDAKPGSSAALDMRRSRGKVRRCGGASTLHGARNDFDGERTDGGRCRPACAGRGRYPPYVVCEHKHKG